MLLCYRDSKAIPRREETGHWQHRIHCRIPSTFRNFGPNPPRIKDCCSGSLESDLFVPRTFHFDAQNILQTKRAIHCLARSCNTHTPATSHNIQQRNMIAWEALDALTALALRCFSEMLCSCNKRDISCKLKIPQEISRCNSLLLIAAQCCL